ncbi:MAG: aspartate/glutamate racemase family protein [Lautropia sp.]|nr:aspartate/glutamate racemase family protein [Lautropia sp.]
MILVLNPNSTQDVTDHIDRSLQSFRLPGGPQIVCDTLRSGPPGIESQAHVDGTSERLLDYFATHPQRRPPAALVLACFSDPGVFAMREELNCPVFGSAECAYFTAAARGERFGVISILARVVPRHRRQVRLLGLEHKLAADLPIGRSVVALSDEDATLSRLLEVGRTLVQSHGADVVVLGCAGMARYRDRLEDALQVPVIDPTQAAVAMAIGTLLQRGGG